jgi:hypothetical protein
MRRLAWVSYGTAAGLAVGTVAALASGLEILGPTGAAAGAVVAVVWGRMRERAGATARGRR